MRWLKRWKIQTLLTGTGPGFSSENRNHDVFGIFTHSCLRARFNLTRLIAVVLVACAPSAAAFADAGAAS